MKQSKFTIMTLVLFFIFLLAITGCTPKNNTNIEPFPAQRDAAYPLTIRNYDSQENLVSYTYQKPPERVVITHPGATELLLELGLKDRILSTVAPYGPPLERLADQYAALSIMKAQYDPSQEELLEMQPHMIISWPHQFSPHAMGEVKTWNGRGVGTFIMASTLTKTPPTLENALYASISDLGKIFMIQEKTNLYIQQAKAQVAKVERAVKNVQKKKTVMVLQDHSNGTFSLYDSRYLISHLIDVAGGENVVKEPASLVGAEKVLSFDPDFIIFVTSNHHDSTRDLTDKEAMENLQGIKALRSMRAIRQGNIINLSFFTVNNGGIRTINSIEKIAKALYPELTL